MSENGPKSTKRTRYMLKSNTSHIDAVQTESTEPKLKQKPKDQLELMDLNDDCLLKIFGYLNVTKIWMIAETCKRAQALAQYTFRLKRHRLDLSILSNISSLKFDWKSLEGFDKIAEISWEDTENFLCIFGNCIQSLSISQDQLVESKSQKILTLIGKHCGKNLTELELKKIHIKTEWMENAEQLFGSLKTLVLKECFFEVKYFYLCPSTENLEVLDVQFQASQKIEYKAVIRFLNTAKALKCFSIRIFPQLPRVIANAIGQSIHLEELGIDSGEMDTRLMKSIVGLKKIKVLKLGHFDLTEMQLLDIAKNLKFLTELHINSTTQQGLVEMVREADRLSLLKINRKFNFQLNIDTYKDILKILQNRPEHIKLTVKLYSNSMKNYWLPSNAKWLNVALRPSGRIYQTARMSTGGKAPLRNYRLIMN